jgi:hypothetical protein
MVLKIGRFARYRNQMLQLALALWRLLRVIVFAERSQSEPLACGLKVFYRLKTTA